MGIKPEVHLLSVKFAFRVAVSRRAGGMCGFNIHLIHTDAAIGRFLEACLH